METLNKEWKELEEKESQLNEEISILNKNMYKIKEMKNDLWHKTDFTEYVLYAGEWVRKEDIRENKLLSVTYE